MGIYTFHQTTIGHRHIKEQSLCEDASVSQTGNACAIAAVADGHGSAIYCRSRIGSALAVQAAQDVFTEFASQTPAALSEQLGSPETCQQTARQLTDRILAYWHDAVNRHLQEHPLQETELEAVPQHFAALFRSGKETATMYGTTLIAALRLENYLLLVQQGDGRCVVFYGDGTFHQPIPWDSRCYDTYTTSLCEEDAPEHFRSYVISLQETPVTAVFLGTDGVEDSFRTMDDMHIFYMKLLVFLKNHPDTFEAELEQLLPSLTRKGSQDDISIAGIIHTERLLPLIAKIHHYVTSRAKQGKEDKLQKKLDHMRSQHDYLKSDLHHCELAVLEKTSAKLKKGEAVTREALEAVIRNADPRLTETCFDCIEARINFTDYHARYMELLQQQQSREKS